MNIIYIFLGKPKAAISFGSTYVFCLTVSEIMSVDGSSDCRYRNRINICIFPFVIGLCMGSKRPPTAFFP